MTTVHCLHCEKEIPLEEAFHAQPKGFRCDKCHREHNAGWILIGIFVAIVIFIVSVAG